MKLTEREKQIVARLRKNAPQWLPSRALYSAADAIERGEPWKDSRP